MMLGFGMGWLWLVGIGLLAWFAIDRTSGAAYPVDPTPRQRLEERYARGEIDTDEFTTRLATLEGSTR